MILVLGGTHEGAELCHWLMKKDISFKLSVATELGKQIYEAFGASCEVHRFTVESLKTYILDYTIDMLIDTTHPHAYEVKRVAHSAAKQAGIRYVKLERAMMASHELVNWEEKLGDQLTSVKVMEEAVKKLIAAHREHYHYLITGTKYIELFYAHFPKSCCFFRVMPSLYSMKVCTDLQVPIDHIIGIKAPCPSALNQALFKAFDITHFIFKESGAGSATELNLQSLIGTPVKGVLVTKGESKDEDTILNDGSTTFHSIETLEQFLRSKFLVNRSQ
ncbi:precorrin-6A/cobalt-precorrin-6A reductase [Fusibacter bizertensis]|uniref:Precorrin-6A/cobalt-precorrin-6A reductase n=1 Tax=Fusibacter bizertensis TaxID=1488331 RepID=A0ABT6NH17_9FIRM|nr:precorrin-6A/cobalt-precorrin-6A reductase [Fusibacter bizertensis]MDH8679706.1 precorrin-6A/cobalt-precorrin-6A reductase [Fusibacter bizertensis]